MQQINKHAMMVTGIIELFSIGYHCNDCMNEYYQLLPNHNILMEYKDNETDASLIILPVNEIYDILKTWSLVELRDYLILLIPLSTSGGHQNNNYSSVKQLKLAIDIIEKDIQMTNLININNELKTENNKLKKKLEQNKKEIRIN